VFTDGISNKLVGCCLKSDREKSDMVLIRVYGMKGDLIVDREAELKTMVLLHAVGCSEPLYATFQNGLSYGFVQGECLDEKTVRDEHIAKYGHDFWFDMGYSIICCIYLQTYCS
jgi:ethanolamine kinase